MGGGRREEVMLTVFLLQLAASDLDPATSKHSLVSLKVRSVTAPFFPVG